MLKRFTTAAMRTGAIHYNPSARGFALLPSTGHTVNPFTCAAIIGAANQRRGFATSLEQNDRSFKEFSENIKLATDKFLEFTILSSGSNEVTSHLIESNSDKQNYMLLSNLLQDKEIQDRLSATMESDGFSYYDSISGYFALANAAKENIGSRSLG